MSKNGSQIKISQIKSEEKNWVLVGKCPIWSSKRGVPVLSEWRRWREVWCRCSCRARIHFLKQDKVSFNSHAQTVHFPSKCREHCLSCLTTASRPEGCGAVSWARCMAPGRMPRLRTTGTASRRRRGVAGTKSLPGSARAGCQRWWGGRAEGNASRGQS